MGDWQNANRMLIRCKKQKPDDRHIQRLLTFMVFSFCGVFWPSWFAVFVVFFQNILSHSVPAIFGSHNAINLERISTIWALEIFRSRRDVVEGFHSYLTANKALLIRLLNNICQLLIANSKSFKADLWKNAHEWICNRMHYQSSESDRPACWHLACHRPHCSNNVSAGAAPSKAMR